ncbi:Zn-dependent exopeptidase [Lactarius hengduanensis]|nr:Zn-dependent exopeptidase [Lactarius hengduanensis]
MIIAKLLQTLSVLVVFPHDHPDIASNKCLTQSYFGTYGTQSVFIPPESCVNSFAPTTDVPNVHLHPSAQLVWLEQAALEQRLLTDHPFSLNTLKGYLGLPIDAGENTYGSISGKQQPLGPARDTILHHTSTSALLALSHTRVRDLSLILPPTWRIYVLPSMPILPVPEPAIARVRDILANLKFDPEVAKIVSNISVPQIQNDIRFLTGEDGKSGIESRHSFSSGAGVAAEWLKTRFEATGAKCELRPFLSGFAPNVVYRYPSTEDTTETVLVSGHYDSRGSFGSTRAPGANDDGSGTTGLLSIARTIKRLGVTFRSNVELVAFAGEEQGLYGSRYYAADLREEEKNLTLMVQADMIAYHQPGEPPQLGLPAYIGTPEVTQLVANLSAIYSPELVVGFTPACCSDHQSFHYQGFPATQVFERAGPIADPMYHNSGDLSDREGYDFEQLKSIAKVQFATLLHVAGFDLP